MGNIPKLFKILILSLIIETLIISNASAISLSKGFGGSNALVFLNNGMGARPIGMGNAFVGIADDINAIYWNPSGLTQLKNVEFSAMHSSLFSDIVKYDMLSLAFPFKNGLTMGAGLFSLNIDNIRYSYVDSLGNPVPTETYFKDSENALFLSVAKSVNAKLSVGGNIKIIYHSLYNYSAFGAGGDLAFLYRPSKNLKIGFNAQNIFFTGLQFRSGGAKNIAYPSLNLGISYVLRDKVRTAVCVEKNLYTNLFKYSLGIELDLMRYLSVRTGLEMGRLNGGVTFKLFKYQLDYSYSHAFSEINLGNSHRLSMIVRF